MAGLGSSGLLDVPLHPDEEERLVCCKLNVEPLSQDFVQVHWKPLCHRGQKSTHPYGEFLWCDPSGWMPDSGVISSFVVKEPAVKLSCVMSEGKGSHTSSSNEGKGRMLRLRHSSSNSLRVGLTKLNLLVGWCS